jgi:hypothetical protein
MKEGLNKHAEVSRIASSRSQRRPDPCSSFMQKLKDLPVHITVADDRERDRPSDRGGFGGRGRGGRGGGFAQRAAAQAGLVRHPSGNSGKRPENGDAGSRPAGDTPKES